MSILATSVRNITKGYTSRIALDYWDMDSFPFFLWIYSRAESWTSHTLYAQLQRLAVKISKINFAGLKEPKE